MPVAAKGVIGLPLAAGLVGGSGWCFTIGQGRQQFAPGLAIPGIRLAVSIHAQRLFRQKGDGVAHSPALSVPGVQQGPQLRGNGFPRAEDARADGADGAIHHVGNLFVTQAFDLAQRDRLPQVL